MLQKLRKEIDDCDDEIVKLFSKRMKAVCKISEYKRENGIQIFDAEREKNLKNRVLEQTEPEMQSYINELFDKILELSKKYQENLRKNS